MAEDALAGRSARVTLTDAEFEHMYATFERSMAPWVSHRELIEVEKAEREIWHWLQEVQARRMADRVEKPRSQTEQGREK